MAKIALLTRKMSPQALGLAQALQFHRHEVILITSAGESVPDGLTYQVLTYFKTWSAFEALKFFPRILGQAPEVWHFVFAEPMSEKPTPAHWVLAQFARALPGRVVAASFYGSLFKIPSSRAAPLLKSCDIVTTATRENLMFLKRKSWLSRHCETEVLPPFVPHVPVQENEVLDQDLKQLIDAAAPYLVIPSQVLPEGDWESILGHVQLIVCGQRPERALEGVFYVGHNLTDAQFAAILKSSQGMITAMDDLSIVEQLHYQRLCAHTKTPMLANSRQAEALPGFCVNKRNGFLIQDISSLHHLLQENPRLELNSPLFEPLKTELADSALNELNRLYSKIRHIKTSSIDFKRRPLS